MKDSVTTTIMIVEDDLTILRLLEEIVLSEGFDAVGVTHPRDVLDAAHACRPALVIIDVMLPSRSGIEVAEQLRAHGYADTPMIAMSASTIMRELAMHSELFQTTVGKPFEIDRLCDLLHALTTPKGATFRPPIR